MTSRTRLAQAAFLLAVAAGLFFAFAPLGTTCTAQPGGQGRCFGTSIFESASGGMFFVPAAVLMTIAATRRDPEHASMDRRVTSEA